MTDEVKRNNSWRTDHVQDISTVLKNTKNSKAGLIGRMAAQALSFMADLLVKQGEKRSGVAREVNQRTGL